MTPTKIGTFMGKCTELCGTYHSRMLFNVKVVSAEEYAAHVKSLADSGNTGLAEGSVFVTQQAGLNETGGQEGPPQLIASTLPQTSPTPWAATSFGC